MRDKRLNRAAEKAFAHGFFFFFSYQIFSPQIGDRTIYLEYFFILFNPFFWDWLSRVRFRSNKFVLAFVAIIFVPFYTVAAIKLIIIGVGVSFLIYCHERRLFFINAYIFASIGFALIQFAFVVSGHANLAIAIGPNNLSSLVWGGYATQTFTNFYTLILLPRVSGLSREAGFFASFLITGFLAVLINRNISGREAGYRTSVFYSVGMLISLSKISAAVVIAAILIKIRRFIDIVPLFFIGVAFVVALVIFWNHFQAFLLLSNNGTFFGRFSAYALIDNLNLPQLLFGVQDISDLHSPLAKVAVSHGYTSLYGLGGWFLQNGLIAYALYMLSLRLFGIRGSGFLFILLMTATVGIDTNQNFCVLSYYIAFMLPKVRKFAMVRKQVPVVRRHSRPLLSNAWLKTSPGN